MRWLCDLAVLHSSNWLGGNGWLTNINRHVNATKSYLHFDRIAGEAILCSNFFCFSLFLDVLFLS